MLMPSLQDPIVPLDQAGTYTVELVCRKAVIVRQAHGLQPELAELALPLDVTYGGSAQSKL